MCIMSQSVRDISGTSIFVSDLGRGIHCTVYEMEVDTDTPVAMILPVPVLQGSGLDALEFVNLQGYPKFFDDMDKLFPEPMSRAVGVAGGTRSKGVLKVHDVGDFVASYAPNRSSMLKLDPRFQLKPNIWTSLPDYGNFGFAVFQLKPGLGSKKIHPMAYKYPSEQPNELFFPTVHVHDGSHAEKLADFDHKLYFQVSPNFMDVSGWEKGKISVQTKIDLPLTQGLVRPEASIMRKRVNGKEENADYVLVSQEFHADEVHRSVRVA